MLRNLNHVVFIITSMLSISMYPALPSQEPKSAPDVSFLRLVENTSSIVQLLEKHFRDYVVPAVG